MKMGLRVIRSRFEKSVMSFGSGLNGSRKILVSSIRSADAIAGIIKISVFESRIFLVRLRFSLIESMCLGCSISTLLSTLSRLPRSVNITLSLLENSFYKMGAIISLLMGSATYYILVESIHYYFGRVECNLLSGVVEHIQQ